MALFGLFNKKEKNSGNVKKGFYAVSVKSVEKLTSDTVKISLNIPAELNSDFKFIPGQYISVSKNIHGKEERRSYSICSGPNEPIAFAVKKINKGLISTWLNTDIVPGTILHITKPIGNFILKDSYKKIVAIAAGSGITPVMSIAKFMESKAGHMELFYGNRTVESIIFHSEIEELKHVKTHYFLSGHQQEGYSYGRINKDTFTSKIKENLDLLKADAFFICGPEEMILEVSKTLEFFGIPKSKIHFELFTVPVNMPKTETNVSSVFEGESNIKVILDSEVVEFTLGAKGKSILDATEKAGIDAPFSCRGGVCCSCKAKVIKGSATMTMNYSLTDEEIHEGYILTCQAHPSSKEVTISFDA